MKKNIILSLMLIAFVSSCLYLATCDYVSADTCRNYVIANQDSLEWNPAEFPYRNGGGCFSLSASNLGMGYYSEITIQNIGIDCCEIIAWSNRKKFIYKYTPKRVDKIFRIQGDSVLLSVLKKKQVIKDSVIKAFYIITPESVKGMLANGFMNGAVYRIRKTDVGIIEEMIREEIRQQVKRESKGEKQLGHKELEAELQNRINELMIKGDIRATLAELTVSEKK